VQARLRAFLALSPLTFTPAAFAVPQTATSPGSSPASFERLADSGPLGVVTLRFDALDYAGLAAQHALGQPFALEDLPLPGGGAADLELRPVSALEPGARAQVVLRDGRVRLVEPRVRCFAGQVEGGGAVFLGLSGEQLHGYLHHGGELYYLSSGQGAGRGRATLAHSSQTGDMDVIPCGVEGGALPYDGEIVERATTPVLRTADVFVEADNVYRSKFASDQDCIDYTVLLITAASEIYRRDIGARLWIPDRYLRVWNTTPPWGVITGFASLKNVYTWWQSPQNPLRSLPRAAVHVLTSPIFGGTSRGIDGLCDSSRAYEISSLSGSFPYPIQHTSRYNWDLFVVCHEFGHTFGSPHSSQYSPPIECTDGSGPDSGTIMSYCHTQYGIAKVGMRFHLREQQKIRTAMADETCVRTQALAPGDYDGDGDLDGADLAAARSVLAQGFRSLGAEETLDVDADGDLDALDHDLLAALAYGAPPASVTLRNGTDLNPPALSAQTNPVLGTTWTTRIQSDAGSATLLVGYDLPLPGVRTARGELLVSTTPYGGTKLFSQTSTSTGTFAQHDLPLPLDPALYGRAVSFQGLVTTASGDEYYTNALDVVLSPYEALAGQ
jgi:hypothetical protein